MAQPPYAPAPSNNLVPTPTDPSLCRNCGQGKTPRFHAGANDYQWFCANADCYLSK